MLFHQLIFSVLLASQVLCSPSSARIDIHDDSSDVAREYLSDPQSYQPVVDGLVKQQELLEGLINSLLMLPDTGSTGMKQTVTDTEDYAHVLTTQTLDTPEQRFDEKETAFVYKAFVDTTDALVVFSEVIYSYNETIKGLDDNHLFPNSFMIVRVNWMLYSLSLQRAVHSCQEDLKNCMGAHKFYKIDTEVTHVMNIAWESIRPENSFFNIQVEL